MFKAKQVQISNAVEPARKVCIWTIYIEEVFQKINSFIENAYIRDWSLLHIDCQLIDNMSPMLGV
jgi:hypothetical protein